MNICWIKSLLYVRTTQVVDNQKWDLSMTHTLVLSRGDLKNIYSMASLHLAYHSCLEKTRDQSQCWVIDNLFLEQLLSICLSMPTPRIVTPLKEIRTQMSWGTIVLPQSLPFSALLAQDWLQTLIFSGQSVPWKSWPVGSYAGPHISRCPGGMTTLLQTAQKERRVVATIDCWSHCSAVTGKHWVADQTEEGCRNV